MKLEIENEDIDFIVGILGLRKIECEVKLKGQLGHIERQNWEWELTKCKQLLTQLLN